MQPEIIRPRAFIIDYADNIGCARHAAGFLKRRAAKNNLTGDFDDLLWKDRIGARCEAVGKVYANPIRWHALLERVRGTPDLGDFIDVKGRSREHYDMMVQKDDEDDFAFLLITAERHPDYLIWGWLWGHEAKQPKWLADKSKKNREAYFVPEEELRAPAELLDLVRRKSAA